MQLIRRLGVLAMWLLIIGGVTANALNDHTDSRTELEQLRVENVKLQEQLARAVAGADGCTAELGQTRTRLNALVVATAKAKLKADLQAAHPDHTVTDDLELVTREPPPGAKP